MFDLIKKDIFRYYQLEGGYPQKKLTRREKIRIIIINHGLHVVTIYRFGSFVDKLWKISLYWKIVMFPLKIISICLGQIAILLYGSLIIRGATIGGGFYIGHTGGIVIGPTSIGKNFTITHNLTIGQGKTGAARGIPIIGDNVWIATNAVLFGNIKIGSGVSIGPGSILSKSIGNRSFVAGNPARIIKRDYDNAELLFGIDTKNN